MPVRDQIKSNPVQQSSRYYISQSESITKSEIENIIIHSY
jgi:hypothetical protein